MFLKLYEGEDVFLIFGSNVEKFLMKRLWGRLRVLFLEVVEESFWLNLKVLKKKI